MTTTTDQSEIVIIGGGVVGCAIFRRLAMLGLRPLLLEAGGDILSGASKGNSALLHTGFDAPQGSLELACMQTGYREYLDIKDRLNLPLVESTALVVAWDDEQLAKLPGIVAKAHDNNVPDVRQIDRADLRQREPHLADHAKGAVLVPGEHIIDPWSAPLAYVKQGIAHGGEVRRRCRVIDGRQQGGSWRLETSSGPVIARCVINAAGNYGDLVEAICRKSPFMPPNCSRRSSCRSRPSAPKASSCAARLSAICWSGRQRKIRKTGHWPRSIKQPCSI